MAMKVLIAAILLFLPSQNARAQSILRHDFPKFLGREVIVAEPETDADGFYPKGPASICVEGPPQKQCYTAPEDFGRNPTVESVQLGKDMPAILFSAASGGVSGWRIHCALLRPGTGKELEDLFLSQMSVSNQNQHAFWTDSTISAVQIFVTAEFVWGPNEGHYGEHRYIISAYVLKDSSKIEAPGFYLEDRYMTVHKYDLEAKADVLAAEKKEIIARLRRLKGETVQ